MYGIGTYFAILKAMRAFNPNLKLELWAPMTHQKCLMSLYDNYGAPPKKAVTADDVGAELQIASKASAFAAREPALS